MSQYDMRLLAVIGIGVAFIGVTLLLVKLLGPIGWFWMLTVIPLALGWLKH
jgi:hypothetical protein